MFLLLLLSSACAPEPEPPVRLEPASDPSPADCPEPTLEGDWSVRASASRDDCGVADLFDADPPEQWGWSWATEVASIDDTGFSLVLLATDGWEADMRCRLDGPVFHCTAADNDWLTLRGSFHPSWVLFDATLLWVRDLADCESTWLVEGRIML